jgi:hypothetical protein
MDRSLLEHWDVQNSNSPPPVLGTPILDTEQTIATPRTNVLVAPGTSETVRPPAVREYPCIPCIVTRGSPK